MKQLQSEGLTPEFLQLDIADKTSVESARKSVAEKYGRLDILVNNAGIFMSVSRQILHLFLLFKKNFLCEIAQPIMSCFSAMPIALLIISCRLKTLICHTEQNRRLTSTFLGLTLQLKLSGVYFNQTVGSWTSSL